MSPTQQRSTDHSAILTAYRHDAHKFTGTPHGAGKQTLDGVPVNRSVPFGADSDAAALSRPHGKPEQTVEAHATHYRLSLLTGQTQYDREEIPQSTLENELLLETNPTTLHESWLTTDIASSFNESVYYPYTSLKYHTLLVAALVSNYRAGHEFSDLSLIVDPPGEIVPHRTVYYNPHFGLRIDAETNNRPAATVGRQPSRSWASVWAQLGSHPLRTDSNENEMVLDANLRRIRSWSTALQYLEEFFEVFER